MKNGFTGLSIFHQLDCLCKFDVLQDFTFDAMHMILLGNIKYHLDYYKERRFLL